jgi:hypothetical protein
VYAPRNALDLAMLAGPSETHALSCAALMKTGRLRINPDVRTICDETGKSEWVRSLTEQLDKFIQVSFASNDAMMLMHYKENARKCGWESPLIATGVKTGWLEEWTASLNKCSAALVLFSEAYRTKFHGGPLEKESKVLLKRLDEDESFTLYVCDPANAEQGPTVIRAWLQDEASHKNLKEWKRFVTSPPPPPLTPKRQSSTPPTISLPPIPGFHEVGTNAGRPRRASDPSQHPMRMSL